MDFISNLFGPSKEDKRKKAAVVQEANDLSKKNNRPVATWDGKPGSKIKSNPFDTIGKRGGRKRRRTRRKRRKSRKKRRKSRKKRRKSRRKRRR